MGVHVPRCRYAGALIAVLSAGVIGSHFLRRQGQSKSKTILVDGALILTFLALPIIALIVTRIMRAGMLDRYVLATIFGVCLATACLLARATLPTVLLVALFLGSSVGLHEISFWRGIHGIHPQSDTTTVEQFIERAGHAELPVVVQTASPTCLSTTMRLQIGQDGSFLWEMRIWQRNIWPPTALTRT